MLKFTFSFIFLLIFLPLKSYAICGIFHGLDELSAQEKEKLKKYESEGMDYLKKVNFNQTNNNDLIKGLEYLKRSSICADITSLSGASVSQRVRCLTSSPVDENVDLSGFSNLSEQSDKVSEIKTHWEDYYSNIEGKIGTRKMLSGVYAISQTISSNVQLEIPLEKCSLTIKGKVFKSGAIVGNSSDILKILSDKTYHNCVSNVYEQGGFGELGLKVVKETIENNSVFVNLTNASDLLSAFDKLNNGGSNDPSEGPSGLKLETDTCESTGDVCVSADGKASFSVECNGVGVKFSTDGGISLTASIPLISSSSSQN